MKGIFTCIILLLFVVSYGLAQVEVQVNEGITEAPYIFKGKVIKHKVAYGTDEILYASYQIEIEEVYKGADLKVGTIEFITVAPFNWSLAPDGGTLKGKINWGTYSNEPGSEPEHDVELQFDNGETCVFVCEKLTTVPIERRKTDNSIIVTSFCTSNKCVFRQRVIKETDETHTKFSYRTQTAGFNKSFKTLDLFVEYMKSIGIDMAEKKSPKKKDSGIDEKQANAERYAKNVKNYEDYIQQREEQINNDKSTKDVPCDDFFISEYLDGPGKNKVIEIYNPTEETKSLDNHSIRIFNNGAPTPTEIELSGDVLAKETYVVTNPLADQEILDKADLTSNKMNFDGNDAIVLNRGQSTYLDKIGEIGVNPGNNTGWEVPPNGNTKANNLRRKFPVKEGQNDWNNGKNEWNVFPPQALENIKEHTNICKDVASNELTFEFGNAVETEDINHRYFEFDILVSANNNDTYFDNCLLRLSYSTFAFGSDIVANNKITITKSNAYSDISYIDPDTIAIDWASDVIGVPFGTYFDTAGTWNRTLVTTVPTPMLHFKIEISGCMIYSNIDFSDIAFTPMFSRYTDNPGEDVIYGDIYSYDNTSYLNYLNVLLCEIRIDDFSPDTITAGTGSILTIYGKGFGNNRGTGSVCFKNGDENMYSALVYIRNLDYIEYKEWTDTLIRVVVPSKTDTMAAENNYNYPTAASGDFYVRNNINDSTFSPTSLVIPYSVLNKTWNDGTAWPNFRKVPNRLVDNNIFDTVPGGFGFYVDTSITNNPEISRIVEMCLRDWTCETSVNFYIIDTIIHQGNIENDTSVIYLNDNWHGQPIGRQSEFGKTLCQWTTAEEVYYNAEMDIGISRDLTAIGDTWAIDSTKTDTIQIDEHDMYEIILHELGHAHGLDHVYPLWNLMYPSSDANYVDLPQDRVLLDYEDENYAIAGGIYVLNQSIAFNFSACDNVTNMQPGDVSECSDNSDIKEILQKIAEVRIYPNPTDQGITVEYSLKTKSDVEFSLMDYMGKEVIRGHEQNVTFGEHTRYIDMQNVSAGLYFLRIGVNSDYKTVKIIKQ